MRSAFPNRQRHVMSFTACSRSRVACGAVGSALPKQTRGKEGKRSSHHRKRSVLSETVSRRVAQPHVHEFDGQRLRSHKSRSVSPSTGLFAHSDGSRGVQACARRSGCTFGRERQQDQSNFGCLYCKTFFNNLRCSVGSRKSAAIHFPARDRAPQNPQAVTRGARRRTCPNSRSAYERL